MTLTPVHTDKVLMIGSGPSARSIVDYDYVKNGWVIVAINHGWMACGEWTYMVHSHDYQKKLPRPSPTQLVTDDIEQILNHFGGYDTIGFSTTLIASHWALHNLKPKIIGFLGCDMNYTPDINGHTCIYGIGEDIQRYNQSDPDRMVAQYKKSDPDFLNTIYNRFFKTAQGRGCAVVNFSKDKSSRLPYGRQIPERYNDEWIAQV